MSRKRCGKKSLVKFDVGYIISSIIIDIKKQWKYWLLIHTFLLNHTKLKLKYVTVYEFINVVFRNIFLIRTIEYRY